MAIKTNQQLSETIESIIDDNSIKKIWLAEKLGISNQNFSSACYIQETKT